MALHVRELSRCAAVVLARQLRICARLAPSYQYQSSISTKSLESVRGVASSACCNNNGGPSRDTTGAGGGGAPIKGVSGKNQAVVKENNVETIRIEFGEPSDATSYSRVLAEATRDVLATDSGKEGAVTRATVGRGWGKESQKTSPLSELIDHQQAGGLNSTGTKRLETDEKSLSKRVECSTLPTERTSTYKEFEGNPIPFLHPHRKESVFAGKPRAGKFQKKKSQNPKTDQAGVTDPMSKLAKDINQWFNDVMDHLAKAENAAASSRDQNVQSPSSGKNQEPRWKKSKSVRVSKKIAAMKTLDPTINKYGSTWKPSIFLKENGFGSKKNSPSLQKPELNTTESKSLPARPSGMLSNASALSTAEKNLRLQLSALNSEMARNELAGKTNRGQGHDAGTSRIQGVSEGRDATKMLEIKPSLVENTEGTDACLASSAGWWPYGAPRDNLPEILTCDNSKDTNISEIRSKPNTPTPSPSATAAASQVTSGSAKNKMATINVASSESISDAKTSFASKKCSLEKEKGFILLNTKEKERERQAWLERKREKEAFQSKKNAGFILVDPENPTTSSPLRSSGNNILLLNDNPHIAAAEILEGKAEQKKQTSSAKYVSTKGNATGSEDSKHMINSVERGDSSLSENKTMTETGKEATGLPAANEETKRWVDMVNQKLSEIMESKIAASERDQVEASVVKKAVIGQAVIERAQSENAKPAENIQKSRSTSLKEASPDAGQKNEPGLDKMKPSPSEPQDYGSDITKGKISDPKQMDDVDKEYERRIGELINGSMGYEDAGDSNTVTRLFGPLSRQQHKLLEEMQQTEKTRVPPGTSRIIGHKDKASSAQNKDIANHPYLQRTTQPKPVSVNELRPVVKSEPERKTPKKEDPRKESEPKLCVKPEEIVSARKSTGGAHSSTSMESTDTVPVSVIQELDGFRSTNSGDSSKEVGKECSDPALSTHELWLSMLQSRMDAYRVLSESGAEKRKEQLSKPDTTLYAKIQEADPSPKPSNKNSKTERGQNMPDSMNSQDFIINPDLVQTRASQNFTQAGLKDEKATAIFQEEFLKMQQEKLKRSLHAKQGSKKVIDYAQKHGNTLETKMPSLLAVATNSEDTLKSAQELALEKAELNRAEESRAQKKRIISPCGEANSARKTQNETAANGKVASFEAREQARKNLDYSGADKTSTSNKCTSVNPKSNKTNDDEKRSKLESRKLAIQNDIPAKKSPKKKNKKKKYPRFKAQPRPEIAQSVYRDIRATYAQAQPKSVDANASNITRDTPTKQQSVSNLSQSDQIYNLIKDSVPPRSPFEPAHLTSPTTSSPLARRSRVLTQSGLGAITSSKTGLVDPARVPKLGNLFGSFDGFIAMDAVPVLDETSAKPSASNTASTEIADASATQRTIEDSKSSDYGLRGHDVRASLAKEREAASVAARKKLIEEYEKSIAKYERGLEMYRSRLRRVKQAMADTEISTTRNDNPRRHSDS